MPIVSNITIMSTNNTTLTTASPTDHAFDQLLPTLLECFAIIFCGYMCGYFKVLTKTEMTGLNFFTTNFALPSLLFLNLAALNFTGVNWSFVAGITFGKAVVFVGVAVAIALIVKPVNWATIAIYAIFCTHVNDFGLGYPIVQSVYEERHPEYPAFMYVIGLVSLVILNPIGFFMIEIEQATKEGKEEKEKKALGHRPYLIRVSANCHSFLKPYFHVLRRVLTNPNVFMTVLGVLANVTFQGHLPETIKGIFQIFSATFQGSVLFLLGFQVAGASLVTGSSFLIPGLLLAIKMLLSPLLTRATVQIFCGNAPDGNELEDYGFLYGTVPTAPVVLLYASQFGIPTEMLATTLVLCTFLSGPIMYISARMLAVQAYDVLEYLVQIRETILCLSILSVLACVWVTFLFFMRGKWRKGPHTLTLGLVSSQFLMSIGLLLWSLDGGRLYESWQLYVEIFTITGGQLASRFWTALIAVALCLNQRFVHKGRFLRYLISIGVVFPVIAVMCLVVSTQLQEVLQYGKNSVPSFLFGQNEALMAVVILSFCLVTTIGCLVVFYRLQNDIKKNSGAMVAPSKDKESDVEGRFPKERVERKTETECKVKIDIYKPPTESNDHNLLRSTSQKTLISNCESSTMEQDSPSNAKEMEFLRHVTLLIALSISMMVGLTTSIWKVLADRQTGIFVALEFLDVILNYGQALFCLCIFGRDINVIIVPIMKCYEKLKQRRLKNGEPSASSVDCLDEETQYVCFQFMIYHYQKCLEQLPRDKVWRKKKKQSVFWGWQMVDWLLDQGLSRNRKEAIKQGNQLLRGKIIEEAGNKRTVSKFEDGHCFYTFNADLSVL